jgi:hypothetical protein
MSVVYWDNLKAGRLAGKLVERMVGYLDLYLAARTELK